MLGTQVGNYEVVSQLGLGGMGIVYLAKHTLLGRSAAVKVLRAEMSHNRDIVNRFFNEARAATAIRHPGIVEIYDFGYLPDGSAYIIMEFLDGESLSDRLVRLGRLPVEYSLAATRQIASALGAAHAQQIIHRDLKPENVFIVRDPELPGGERLKLLDFGIAKLAAASGERSQTRTGEVIGTPTFMSPEQCRGAGKVDARADLYALGCLLYTLLCGRPPFIAEGAGDIIAHHLYFPPEPPSRHEPSIPVGVEQLVLSLLQKEPAARPATAADVVAAIDRLGPAQTVSLPPPRPHFPAQVASRPPAPPPALSSTTLSGTASQVRANATPQTLLIRPRARWIVPSAIGAVAALGVVTMLLLGGGERESAALVPQPPPSSAPSPAAAAVTSPPPEPELELELESAPPPLPPAPALIEHVIESIPPGAQVWLGDAQVGTTPFQASLPKEEAARTYTLRKKGYQDELVSFAGDASEAKRGLALRAAAVVPKPKPPAAKPRKPGYNPFE